MQVSVRELLNCEPLTSNTEVLAGQDGLERIITSAGYLDSPLSPDYMKGGAIAFTSAYNYLQDESAFVKLIEKLNSSHISALGISLIFYAELPEAVIQIANDLSFPIIKIHEQLPWQEINRLLDTCVYNRTKRFLKNQSEVINEASKVVFDSSFSGAAKYLSDWTGLKAFVLYEEQWHPREGNIDNMISNDSTTWTRRIRNNKVLNSQYSFFESADGQYQWISQLIGGDTRSGYVILLRGDREFLKDDFDLLQYMAFACRSEANRLNSENFQLQKKRATFLKRLMQNRYSLSAVRTAASECQLDLPNIGYLLDFHFTLHTDLTEFQIGENIKRQITNVFGSSTIIGIYEEGHIIAYVNQKKKHLLQHAYDNISNQTVKSLSVGISRPCNYDGLSVALKEAKNAIEIGDCLNLDTQIYSIDQLGFYQLLQLQDPNIKGALQTYYDDFLNPLKESFDEATSNELLHTLICFVESCYKYNQAAAKLHVHRHTLKYRIDTIAKSCNLDFDKQQDRFNVEIALKLLPLLKES
jgi:purine catabolism regulator